MHKQMELPNTSTVHRQISLMQAVQVKLIPTDLVLVLGMKVQSLDVFSQYYMSPLFFIYWKAQIFDNIDNNGC